MSTTEEKEQAAAEEQASPTEEAPAEAEAPDEEEVQAEEEHEPPKPGNWRFLIPIIAFAIGFGAHFFPGWIIFPHILYAKKEQPINFNHKLHVEEMGECEACHYFREDGSFSGVPKLATCLDCHEEQLGSHPEEAKLITEYVEPGKEIPWLIYARQPQCVFFSHAAHVNMAEMDCFTCHGGIGESTQTKTYQYNRLTLYSRDIWGYNIAGYKKHTWDRMKMDDCAECHLEETGHQGSCFQCHK
jgi:hypothetical protein